MDARQIITKWKKALAAPGNNHISVRRSSLTTVLAGIQAGAIKQQAEKAMSRGSGHRVSLQPALLEVICNAYREPHKPASVPRQPQPPVDSKAITEPSGPSVRIDAGGPTAGQQRPVGDHGADV